MQSGDFMYSKWWWSGCLCWIRFPGIVVQDLTTGWKSLACAELWSLPGVRQLPVRLPYHAIGTYVNTSPGKPLAAVFGVSIWEDRPDGCPKHLPSSTPGGGSFGGRLSAKYRAWMFGDLAVPQSCFGLWYWNHQWQKITDYKDDD